MQHAGVHILKSKLRPPQLKNAVPRPRLMELLLEESDRSVVVIRADAGYGKTVLAAQYLEVAGARPVWYRLDESDASLTVFLTYLTVALQPATGDVPEGPKADESYLQRAALDERSAIAAVLARMEEWVDSPTILVLDDYHTVDCSEPVRAALKMLLANLPEHLRIVFVTRAAPSLSLARLTGAGEVLWLSSEQLEFSDDETRALWRAQGLPSPDGEDGSRKGYELTRGWAAGLTLLSDWLSRGHSLEETSAETLATQGEVYGYLAQEVFDRQPARVQQFLLDTCVLGEVGEQEAEGFANVEQPAELLAHMENESLFFRKSQVSPPVFTCHPLFLSFLQTRLQRERGAGALKQLHGCAARFYGGSGDLDRAVRHGLLSKDGSLVDELGQQHVYSIVHGSRPDLAEKLLGGVRESTTRLWALIL